jgi:hypothetical protein
MVLQWCYSGVTASARKPAVPYAYTTPGARGAYTFGLIIRVSNKSRGVGVTRGVDTITEGHN